MYSYACTSLALTYDTERVYTVRTFTANSPDSGTDDRVYLTMHDVSNNACVETMLDSYGNEFEEGE